MEPFTLNCQLQQDCIHLGTLDDSELLLYNNALIPWFILVPRTSACELFDLDETSLSRLCRAMTTLGRFIDAEYNTDKINTAAIGNIVRQLHIHVVGRYEDDFCWPGVVWGAKVDSKSYSHAEIKAVVARLNSKLGRLFTPAPQHRSEQR